MNTRVIVLLEGGNFLTTYHANETAAKNFINIWVGQRMANEVPGIYYCADRSYAVTAASVIAMYIPADVPTPLERMAAATEKMTESGEGWRGD